MIDQTETANFKQVQQSLLRHIARWERRLRLTQTTLWLPRGMIAGILVGIAVALAARVRPWLLTEQVAALAGLAVILGAVLAVIGVWLYPRTPLAAARLFDRLFGLHERTSTALELSTQAIRAPQLFSALQTQDALQQAAQVQLRQFLPFQWRRNELLAVAALGALLAVLLLIANPQAEVIAQQTALRSAIEEQIERVEQIKRDILANPTLSEAEKQALTQILQELQEKLSQPNLTQPEAVAQLSQAAQLMHNQRSQLSDQQRSALDAVGQALSQSQPLQGTGQALQNGNLGDAANQLQNLARRMEGGQLTQEQLESMIQSLQQAAQALQQVNPAAAQALQQSAQALQQGNLQQAAQALQQASQALQNQQSQLAQSPLTQAAQQAAQQLAQSSNRVAQAGQQPQQGQQGAQSGQQGAQTGQQGQQQGAQAGQQGAQSGQQSAQTGQQGSQSGQQGAQTGQQGSQSGQQGAQAGALGAESGEGDQAGVLGAEGSGQSSGDQTGVQGAQSAGTGSGGAGNDTTQGTPPSGQAAEIGGGRGDGSLGNNEFIYAPTFIGGEGGEVINPRHGRGSEDDLIETGELSQNPRGESRLPIREAVRRAVGGVEQALENDRVPGALRGFIRQYFTDLQR
ncbi:MAG: CvpA family protein [Anaerolineae bacterium]|nr:CvpA family protein [Anaerolineae bacterium]MDW8299392.1 CvpA family protein [Anaerolineae bacterium]